MMMMKKGRNYVCNEFSKAMPCLFFIHSRFNFTLFIYAYKTFLTGYHSSSTDIRHTVLSCRSLRSLGRVVQPFVEALPRSGSCGSGFGGHALCVRGNF